MAKQRCPPTFGWEVVKLIGNTALVEQEVPHEQQMCNGVDLPQFPKGSGFHAKRDSDANCIDIYDATSLVAYIRFNYNGTCRLTRKTGTGAPAFSTYSTYDEARAYVEAVLLLGIEPE